MRSGGYTLWELACTLAVAGIVLSIGAPGFNRFVLDSKRTAEINALVGAIQLARSEAAKRAQPVVLCKTADLERCGGDELGYENGWMLFVNEDDIRPPHRAPEEPLLLVHSPRIEGTIRSNRARFEFRPFRTRSTNGTVTFCDRRGDTHARAVIISYTGRPRVSDSGPSRALSCAP